MSTEKVRIIKATLIAVITSVVLAPSILWVVGMLYGDIELTRLATPLAIIFGLAYSVPLVFGFVASLFLGRQYKKLVLYILIPTLLVDLIYILNSLRDFVLILAISLVIGVVGIGAGFATSLLYKRLKKT